MDPPAEARPRRRIGWVAVTIAVGASVCILAAAAVVRVQEFIHTSPPVSSATGLDARPVAQAGNVPVESTGGSGPQAAHFMTPPNAGESQPTSATRGQPIVVDGHKGGMVPRDVRQSDPGVKTTRQSVLSASNRR